MKKNNTQRGYTLLFAVLTAVLVLGIAVFILGVARKQYNITTTAKDSVIAVYNADSGIQCVVQSDIVGWETTGSMVGNGKSVTIPCSGNSPDVTSTFGLITDYTTVPGYDKSYGRPVNGNNNIKNTFFDINTPTKPIYQIPPGDTTYLYMPLSVSPKTCTMIKIYKGIGFTGQTATLVVSKGYNQCDNTGPVPSVRTVERAMQYSTQ